jgi:hypothetical protein
MCRRAIMPVGDPDLGVECTCIAYRCQRLSRVCSFAVVANMCCALNLASSPASLQHRRSLIWRRIAFALCPLQDGTLCVTSANMANLLSMITFASGGQVVTDRTTTINVQQQVKCKLHSGDLLVRGFALLVTVVQYTSSAEPASCAVHLASAACMRCTVCAAVASERGQQAAPPAGTR